MISILAAIVLVLAPVAEQNPAPPSPASKPAPEKPKPDAKKDAAAWPKLEYTQSVELGKSIDELKRATAPEIVDHASDKIAEFGKGAMNLLYEALSRQKAVPEDELSDEAKRIIKVLNSIPKADDGARLANDCLHRHALIKRFALRKAGELYCSEALSAALKALKDPDEGVRLEAALCSAALGSIDGYDILRKAARDEWPLLGPRIRKATERNRNAEVTQKALPGLKSKEWQEVCASLRLLSGWGVKECAHEVGASLGSTDNRIKEDAINALRGIVDNDQPIEKLSAFDLAEQATAWSKRV